MRPLFSEHAGTPAESGGRRTALPFACDGVAFLIEDALGPEHCEAFTARATALGFSQTGGDYPPSYRNNDRCVMDDADLAATLFAELAPCLPGELTDEEGSVWTLCGLNARFRFCRYRDGQGFRIHQDGAHQPDPDRRSMLTLQFYLDDDPARVGGQTRFYAARHGGLQGGVLPQQGRAIVFDHRLWHDGEPVSTGEKHVVRTDVMYQRQSVAEGRSDVSRDPEEQGPAATLRGHQGYVFALAVLPGGELASGSRDRTIRIWHPTRRADPVCIAGHHGSVSSLCPLQVPGHETATWLLSGGRDHALRIHDIQRGESAAIAELPAAVLCLADCHPDGFAVGCADGSIYIFDRASLLTVGDARLRQAPMSDPQSLSLRQQHGGWVWALLPLPGGRLLSSSEDGCVRLWDLASRALIAEYALGHGAVHALACVPRSQGAERSQMALVAGCADGHLVCLEEAADGRGLRVSAARAVHRGEVYALCVTGSGAILSAGEDGQIQGTHLFAGGLHPAEPSPRGAHPNFIRALALLPDGRVASGGYDGDIAIWPAR